MRGARNSAHHCVAQTRAHALHTHGTATFHIKVPRVVLGPHVGLPLCGAQSADVRGRIHHGHPVLFTGCRTLCRRSWTEWFDLTAGRGSGLGGVTL